MPLVKLMTKAEWDELSPRNQGFALYWQGALPGSELKDLTCPYANGSSEQKEFAAGEFTAVIYAQDAEE